MPFLTSYMIADSVIVAAIIIFAFYKFLTSTHAYWKSRGVEHLTPKLLFGNFQDVIFMKKSIGIWLTELYNGMSGNLLGIWVFGTPHLIVKSPEVIKQILVKDFNHFHDRTITNDESADSLISKIIFTQKGNEWKTMRTKLSPIFTSGKIKTMIPLIIEATEELKEHLNKVALIGETVEIKEICAKYTTDVITSCAFGVHAQSFRHENAAFREVGRKMFDFNFKNAVRSSSYFFAPSIVKLFKLTFFDPSVNEFCREAFWETIRKREEVQVRRNDLIDIIIDMKKMGTFKGINFEGDAVVGQAVQFFIAGFETTSSLISFALYELCLHEEMQTRLRREINNVMSEYHSTPYEALKHMKYLDMVVKETLRKYPVLPFLDRRCMEDYEVPNTDVVIEKGTPIYIPMHALHYDPKYFPNPENFDPERFSEENIGKITPYTYFPFGEGPHNCIGERFGLVTSKLGLVNILSNFVVQQSIETPVPIKFDPRSFILQSTVGLPMKIVQFDRRMSAAA